MDNKALNEDRANLIQMIEELREEVAALSKKKSASTIYLYPQSEGFHSPTSIGATDTGSPVRADTTMDDGHAETSIVQHGDDDGHG